MSETWKDIDGWKGLYQISDEGRVRSLDRVVYCGNGPRVNIGRIMKCSISPKGYVTCVLRFNGKFKGYSVHRLVAIHFIDNPNNLPEVNHKDGNKQNNCKGNLEWATSSGNKKHACETGLNAPPIRVGFTNELSSSSKAIKQLTREGALIKVWPSMAEAERNGFSVSNISACCRGKEPTHKGFKWAYN